MARTSNTPLSRFGIQEPVHERRGEADEQRSQNVARASTNQMIGAMLEQYGHSNALSQLAYVQILSPDTATEFLDAQRKSVLADFDSEASTYTQIRSHAAPEQARALDDTAKKAAACYLNFVTAKLHGFDKQEMKNAALVATVNLYSALADCGTKSGTDAKEAVTEILLNVNFGIFSKTSELPEQIMVGDEPARENKRALKAAGRNEAWVHGGEASQDPSVLLGDYAGRTVETAMPETKRAILSLKR